MLCGPDDFYKKNDFIKVPTYKGDGEAKDL